MAAFRQLIGVQHKTGSFITRNYTGIAAMRIRYGVAAAAVVAALAGSQAFASGPTSAYLGAEGGGIFLDDQTGNAGLGKLSYDTGWAAGGSVGLRWKGGWRGEVEGVHRESDFTNKVGLASSSGTANNTAFMVNGLKDFDLGWKVMPYVGVGLGAGKLRYTTPAARGNDTGGMYQGIVGLTAPFTKKLEGFVDYRYLGAFSNDLPGKDDYMGHQVMAGIRWTFWEAAKPVAAAPAPAPMAAPKDYIIYFEFDRAKITNAAGAVLDELKSTSGGKSVSVVAHTDTSGKAGYNQKLSERRAKATTKALESRGVKVDSATGRGETEPAVVTGDGVKEPLNRRAVIKLNSGMTQ